MKKIAYTLLLLSACLLAQNSFAQCAAFTVLKAESKQWVSGAPGGNYGTEYLIAIKLKTAQPVQIKTLIIDHKEVAFEVSNGNNLPVTKTAVGDTLNIQANVDKRSEESLPASKLSYKGKALLIYKCGGKLCRKTIKELKAMPKLLGM